MKKLSVILSLFIFIGGALESANAADWTVTKATNSNDGACNADCSLREAVAAADSGDTVVFSDSLVGQTLTLGGSEIVITKRITIDGFLNDPNVVFLSGSNTSRHFSVQSGGALDLRNMILAQGNSPTGGSIETAPGGTLLLDRVAIRGNTSSSTGALYLVGDATHRIVNSSITGNTANEIPAIVVSESSRLYVSNTTVSGNRQLGDVPVIRGTITNFGKLVLRNCTITNNESGRGGGVYSGVGDPGDLDIGNSIIAGNTATDVGQDIYVTGNQLLSQGGNLIGNTDTIPAGIFTETNDAVNLNPLLAPTNSNQGGHPVATHPLQAGSPARNTGINSLAVEPLSNLPLTTDARGAGFPRISGGTVDKGAFEDQTGGSTLVVTKLTNSNDNVCDLDCSLREAVFAAGQDAGTDNITMAANVFGTMNIGGTEIRVDNQNVNIIGYPSLSAETLIISGNDASRIFRFENSSVTLTGMTLAGGNGSGQSQPSGGGAIFAFGGSLTLDRVIVRNNRTALAGTFGGGISTSLVNVVRIMNSTINNNQSFQAPGAFISASIAYITNTTVANNNGTSPDGHGALSISDTLYMRNSTIANNRNAGSTSGIGLYCGAAATCNIGNSIFADNSAAGEADLSIEPGGTLQSVGGNLVEDMTGYNTGILTQTNDQIGVDAGLSALSDNGGNVTTIMLVPTSPAINTGLNNIATDPFSAAPLATDARGAGFLRVVSVVDKGAFETLIPTAAAVTISGRVFSGEGMAAVNAKVYLTDSNGITRTTTTNGFGNFMFDTVASGETYIINVTSKRAQYDPQVISVTDNVSDLSFMPQQ